jgi:hypothetical protein
VDNERRKQICEKWNTETNCMREMVSWYMEKFKRDNSISEEEWQELRKEPDSGEMS